MKNPLRSLYNWVLSWADSPYGTWALFSLAFAESSFFPIPPDVLLIALAVGKPKRSLWFAAVCLAGSLAGGFLGYWIGAAGWQAVDQFFFAYIPGFTPEIFDKVADLYRTHAGWAVFIAGFTPIPYKVFTIAGGIAGINIFVFFIASLCSRALRFFIVAGLIRLFGEPIRDFIQKYFDILSIAFAVLLIGGFIIIGKVF